MEKIKEEIIEAIVENMSDEDCYYEALLSKSLYFHDKDDLKIYKKVFESMNLPEKYFSCYFSERNNIFYISISFKDIRKDKKVDYYKEYLKIKFNNMKIIKNKL